MEVKALDRKFVIEKSGLSLPDPNTTLTPNQVMDFYASQYPELTTATVHGPEVSGDAMVYKFKTTIGTKG